MRFNTLKFEHKVSNFVFRVDCVVDETFRADALLCSHYWLGTANPGRGVLRHHSGYVLQIFEIRIGYVMPFEFAFHFSTVQGFKLW